MNSRAILLVAGAVAIALVAMSASGTLSGGLMGSDLYSWEDSENGQAWAPALAAAESANGIPAGLLSSIAYQESSFETAVIEGTQASSAGALGLMQLEPTYFSSVQGTIPFSAADTQAQITQAAQQLASLYSQFGNWPSAVAAYNAGSGTVSAYLNGSGALPAETQNYVTDVLARVPSAGSASTILNARGGSATLASNTGSTGGTGASTGSSGVGSA